MLKKTVFALMAAGLVCAMAACDKGNGASGGAEGIAAYEQKEYGKAYPLLEKAAGSGDAAASAYLGMMLRDGSGVARNTRKACASFLTAAKGGYSGAYLPVSLCYSTGKGLEKDGREAFKWAKKAASEEKQMDEKDRRDLAVLLADSYLSGEGTGVDYAEAVSWYEKAAELDDRRAQGILAYLYYAGKGILIDRERAKLWAGKAAASPNPMQELASAIAGRLEDPPDMKKAVYWYERAAKRGNVWAQGELAAIYEKGEGVKPNLAKAQQYYRLAAKNGDDAMKKALADFERRHKPHKKH